MATALAGRDPGLAAYERDAMAADFAELTSLAEELVEAETGLRSARGPARARVVDRAGWVEANLASFRRLLRPIEQRLELTRSGQGRSLVSRRAEAALSGVQVGLILAWMSTRVLGQYDQLLVEDECPEEQDFVYYVGPNIAQLERRYDFPPRELRLWLALHEVTHRAQFTGVPWMRDHFVSLVDRALGGVETDPRRVLEALRRAAADLRSGARPLDDGGLLALLATPEQRATLQEIGGLMSLLEGHGDVTMDRAALARVPNAPRFSKTLRERRRRRGGARVVSSLVGLDAKLRQYEQGEEFVRAVERAGGRELFDQVWRSPEWLPTLEEVRSPTRWLERAGVAVPAAG